MTLPIPVQPFAPFVEQGAVSEGDALLARHIAQVGGESDDDVVLAVALCLAELRRGAVCVLLDAPAPLEPTVGGHGPQWPQPAAWRARLAASPLVRTDGQPQDRPLRLVGDRLYLQRYWQDEQTIRAVIDAPEGPPYAADEDVAAAVATMFAGDRAPSSAQLEAAAVAARSRVTLLAGGPGTGKTWTVAHILGVLAEVHGGELRVAVAAPTGKAATRLQEAIANERPAAAPAWIAGLKPSTIHRLLGRRAGSHETFRFNRDNPLPHDVVIVDEMSMVSLPLMARLLEAVGPGTRLILVGDPDQLASVEAGAVFGDLVRMRAGREGLVTLRENHRFTGNLQILAEAVRSGDVAGAMAGIAAGGNVEFVESGDGRAAFDAIRQDVVAQAVALDRAARAGEVAQSLAALDAFRLLCAHRHGPHGVWRWSRLIDEWSAAATGRELDGDPWYVGRPLLVTRNDYALRIFNGETGVVVGSVTGGDAVAVIDQGDAKTEYPVTQLGDVETLHAMTVHKAQGSQYRKVTVVLPPAGSPLLTRELLYTAITRAQEGVRIVGTEDAVRAAVGRGVRRASGLA